MRFLQLFPLLLYFVGCVFAADTYPPGSDYLPQPAPGKAFYQIFPTENTDTSQTSDFIKRIVHTEDLLPWTDVNDNLIHWTVEASPEEASQMQKKTL
jgi:hypothetical protein